MFFGVLNLNFEDGLDRRDLNQVCQKILGRHKVCAKYETHDRDGTRVVVAALANAETELEKLFEDLESFVEGMGFGRLLSSETILGDTKDTIESQE